jgi:hypothetical protein
MLEEIRAKFRARFIESARARVSKARAPGAAAAVVASEMHALAGEASLLEFGDCATLARSGEALARAGRLDECGEVLASLAAAVEAL